MESNMNKTDDPDKKSAASDECTKEKEEIQLEKLVEFINDEKTVSLFKKFVKVRAYIDAVLVRLMMFILPSFEIYYLSCIYGSNSFYALFFAFLIIIIDGVYVVKRRSGHDYYWFSISISAYVALSLVLILTITEYKLDHQDTLCLTNITQTTSYSYCGTTYDICIVSRFIIVIFIATIVLARWFLPYSIRMSHEAVYTQIADFTSSAADMIDIADYFDNSLITANVTMSRFLKFIFALNLTQFCFSLQGTKSRNTKLTGFLKLIDSLFVTEAWSQLLLLLTQELPCLIVRLIFIFSFEVGFDFSLYFFVFKNGLMCILLVYRTISLTYEVYADERKIKPVE